MKNSMLLLMSMQKLIDKILVFDVKDIAGTSTDYLGVLHIRLARGEMVMVVPWPHQYDEGGQLCLYPKGDVEVFEIEMILVELIELLEMDQSQWM